MSSSAAAQSLEVEQSHLDKLPRLGHPPPTQAFYEQTMLTERNTITRTLACIGFNINRETYDALWDYCKTELEKRGAYRQEMSPLEIWQHKLKICVKGYEDSRFAFMEDRRIPADWSSWARRGILCKVATWLLDNEKAMNTPRGKRTIDDAEEGDDHISSSKKQKIMSDSSEVLMSYGDIQGGLRVHDSITSSWTPAARI